MRIIKLIAIFIFFWNLSSAQHYYFQEISVSEGLANEKIYKVYEDKNHFIWLGNEYGVSFYNGIQTINYTSADGLGIGGVKSIFQDRFGNMIFGHYDGAISYLKNDKFTVVDSLPITGHVYQIIESNDYLWLATVNSGAYRIKVNRKKDGWDFSHAVNFLGKDGLSDRVFKITELKNGNLLFITDAGLKKYDQQSQKFVNYKKNRIPGYFQFTSILEASDGKLYLGTHTGGLYIFNPQNDKISFLDEKKGLSNNFITDLVEDKQGRIWIGTFGGGLNMLKGKEISIFDNTNGFPDKKIQSLLVNFEGMLLVGTNDFGLQVFKGFQFLNFIDLPENMMGAAFDVAFIDHELFLATGKGLMKLHLSGDGFYTLLAHQVFLPGIGIKFIETDGEKGLWIASDYKVWYFNRTNNELREIKAFNPYFAIINKITSFSKDKFGRLWVGSVEGLLMYNPSNDQVERLSQENGILKNYISVVQAIGDTIWVGSRQSSLGVNYIVGNKVHKIDLPLVNTPISFFKKNTDLWIGTENQGILVISGDSLKKRITIDDGLLSNHISFIRGENRNIWVGNQKGLNYLSANNRTSWISYTKEQGFMGVDCLPGVVFTNDSTMWLGTSQGAILNQINKMPRFDEEILPVISRFLVNNKVAAIDKSIQLNYRQNEILIEVSAVELYAPEMMQLSYRVNGLNQRWKVLDVKQGISLIGIPPGDYSLQIKTLNYNGQLAELKTPLNWTINPPWYYSTWAIIGEIIFVILVFWGFVSYREQNLKRERRILRERVEERTKEIVLKSNQLEQKNKDITDSLHYASRIQQAVLPDTNILSPFGFIYYQPKDIVSGDFYFISREKSSIYICAADCTGHGVPGALLSIMGNNMMDRILNENPDILPHDFLNNLNREVAKTLRHDERQGVNDGMDLALIKLDCQKNELSFSGAFNSLYIISNGKLSELKANRFSVGGQRLKSDTLYQLQKFKLDWGDRIYLFSDGLADQFGGERGKKLKSSGLKNMLLRIQDLGIEKQQKSISDFMNDWKKEEEQIDDILLIGLEINRELKNFKNHD